MRPLRVAVIPEELGQQWNLTSKDFRQIVRREGLLCPFCGSNSRVRHLTRIFLQELGKATGVTFRSLGDASNVDFAANLQIAEINSVAGLHPFLINFPGLSYSEYQSGDPGIPSEDLMRLSYADETFDYVLTSDTLEHVPDFDVAMLEIRRILKPGGKHIFNIPILWDRVTRRRARIVAGKVQHLLPPSYHAGPQPNRSDYLVFNEFGSDVVERIEQSGLTVDVYQDRSNPLISTLVAQRAY
jgi:SAM-dependent methyltransferase